MEQVQEYKRQKENVPSTGASQQPGLSHAPFVALTTGSPISRVTITTATTNSTSSHVSSESLTTANGYSPSFKALVDFNQSNQTQENIASQGHTPQQSDISLASLSSGM